MNILLKIGTAFLVLCFIVIAALPFLCCLALLNPETPKKKYNKNEDQLYFCDRIILLFVMITLLAVIGGLFVIFGLFV